MPDQKPALSSDVLSKDDTKAVVSNSVEGSPPLKDKPVEVGGRKGPDPTRYGDWEKGGRCIDF